MMLTWPELVEQARTYLNVNAEPENASQWARRFATGIVAMDAGVRSAMKPPAPVAIGPDALACAARDPDVVRQIKDSHERTIAFLEERLPRPRTPVDVFGELGRKMEVMAVEGAQQPNHTFRAIAGKAPDCPVPGGCDNPHCRLPAAAPVTAGLAMQGRWRVYFNKHGRADLPWCIAPDGGGWELAVPSVLITTDATTAYQAKATPDDEDGRPSAWIAVEGVFTVAGGRASIAASAVPEVQTP